MSTVSDQSRKVDRSSASGKRKAGRPKGAKGGEKPAGTVATIKVQCQFCKSSDTEWLSRTRQDLAVVGTHDGAPYTRIRWTRRKCRECHRVFIHKQFLNEDDK